MSNLVSVFDTVQKLELHKYSAKPGKGIPMEYEDEAKKTKTPYTLMVDQNGEVVPAGKISSALATIQLIQSLIDENELPKDLAKERFAWVGVEALRLGLPGKPFFNKDNDRALEAKRTLKNSNEVNESNTGKIPPELKQLITKEAFETSAINLVYCRNKRFFGAFDKFVEESTDNRLKDYHQMVVSRCAQVIVLPQQTNPSTTSPRLPCSFFGLECSEQQQK
jgi:hypothetical protein